MGRAVHNSVTAQHRTKWCVDEGMLVERGIMLSCKAYVQVHNTFQVRSRSSMGMKVGVSMPKYASVISFSFPSNFAPIFQTSGT